MMPPETLTVEKLLPILSKFQVRNDDGNFTPVYVRHNGELIPLAGALLQCNHENKQGWFVSLETSMNVANVVIPNNPKPVE